MTGQRSSRVWKPAVAVMAVAGMAGLYSSSRAPHLIAFGSESRKRRPSVAMAPSVQLPTDARFHPVNLGRCVAAPTVVECHMGLRRRLCTGHAGCTEASRCARARHNSEIRSTKRSSPTRPCWCSPTSCRRRKLLVRPQYWSSCEGNSLGPTAQCFGESLSSI